MIDSIISVLRPLWGVWAMVIFVGIVVWVYWPKNRSKIEAYGQIPLKDDENEER